MSKRLQVLLDPKEYKMYQNIAKKSGVSLGKWVRDCLRKFANEYSSKSPRQKLKSIRLSSFHKFPTGDIDQILSEIEEGYLSS